MRSQKRKLLFFKKENYYFFKSMNFFIKDEALYNFIQKNMIKMEREKIQFIPIYYFMALPRAFWPPSRASFSAKKNQMIKKNYPKNATLGCLFSSNCFRL